MKGERPKGFYKTREEETMAFVSALPKAVAKLREQLTHPNPWVQIRAANTILTISHKARERELRQRLDELEAAVATVRGRIKVAPVWRAERGR